MFALAAVLLFLPIAVACGGNGTDFVAQPQELAVLDDCSQATIYTDRIVAGLWNQLCPADPVPAPGVSFNLQTGEFDIRTTVRGKSLHVFGFLSTKLSLVNGLQLGDVATCIFTIVADNGTGEGTLFITPDEKHSLHVYGAIDFGNGRCDVSITDIDFRGWAAGTTVRLWGTVEFESREHSTGDRIEGAVFFEQTELEADPIPPRLDAYRYHGTGPYPERTQYQMHFDPQLFEIFG